MSASEKSLKVWNKANDLSAPTREDLQVMRSLECKPEFLGLNLWQTPSTTKQGVTYKQQVYFAGFDNAYSHGILLNIECTCPSVKNCKHALRIQAVYCANWSYLFILFGLEESKRFGELWTRAQAVYERLQWSSFGQAA